eukprot:GHVH01011369.1.p1 GENE.GHVH01011369.1~~GHVH01011369.1.p1  ORF type:complete len:138 (+),score=6.68 GHVH01011369.1:55-468(+)
MVATSRWIIVQGFAPGLEEPFVKRMRIDNREVAVYRVVVGGKLYCIDANCYHAGGSLTGRARLEEIENIGDEPCISCPIHNYRIGLMSGRRYYQPVEFGRNAVTNKLEATTLPWTSNGQSSPFEPLKQHRKQVSKSP